MLGLAAQVALFAGAGRFGVAETLRVVRATVFDHRRKDAVELVGVGSHRRLGPELGLQPRKQIGTGFLSDLGAGMDDG